MKQPNHQLSDPTFIYKRQITNLTPFPSKSESASTFSPSSPKGIGDVTALITASSILCSRNAANVYRHVLVRLGLARCAACELGWIGAAEAGWSSGVRRLGPSVVEGGSFRSSSMSFGRWRDKSEGEVGMRREWKRNIVFRRTEISGSAEFNQHQ